MSKPYLLLSKRDDADFYDVKVTCNPVLIQKFIEAHKKPVDCQITGRTNTFEGMVFSLDALAQVVSMEIEAKEIREMPGENGTV